MFKSLIYKIEETASLNNQNADKLDVQRSSFTAGMVRAYVDVIKSLGHDVESGSWDDKGCDRISYLKIDGVILMRNSKIDINGYSELLKK